MNVGTKSGETFEQPDEPFKKTAETGIALHTVAQAYTYVCIGLRVYTCSPTRMYVQKRAFCRLSVLDI